MQTTRIFSSPRTTGRHMELCRQVLAKGAPTQLTGWTCWGRRTHDGGNSRTLKAKSLQKPRTSLTLCSTQTMTGQNQAKTYCIPPGSTASSSHSSCLPCPALAPPGTQFSQFHGIHRDSASCTCSCSQRPAYAYKVKSTWTMLLERQLQPR